MMGSLATRPRTRYELQQHNPVVRANNISRYCSRSRSSTSTTASTNVDNDDDHGYSARIVTTLLTLPPHLLPFIAKYLSSKDCSALSRTSTEARKELMGFKLLIVRQPDRMSTIEFLDSLSKNKMKWNPEILVLRKLLGITGRGKLCRIISRKDCAIKQLRIPGKTIRTESVDEGSATSIYAANRLSDADIAEISESLERNKSITALDFSSQFVGDNAMESLSNALQYNKYVQSLCLQGNFIGNRTMEFVANLLENNTTITNLNLSTNCIGNTGVNCLIEALYKNKSLRNLDLRWNDIGDDASNLLQRAWTSKVDSKGEIIPGAISFREIRNLKL
jgi:hypothetical protein